MVPGTPTQATVSVWSVQPASASKRARCEGTSALHLQQSRSATTAAAQNLPGSVKKSIVLKINLAAKLYYTILY